MAQTNIQARIRIQQVAGRVALVVGVGLLVYVLAASNFLPAVFVTKTSFACAPAATPTAPILDPVKREQLGLRLDGAARQVWRDTRQYKQRGLAANPSALRKSLSERKAALVQTMREDPDAAILALLPQADRNYLNGQTNNCLETKVTVQGTLTVRHLDDLNHEISARYEHTLTTSDGDQLALHVAHPNAQELISGMTVRVAGYQIGNEILVDAAAPEVGDVDQGELIVTAAPSAPVLQTNRVAVLMTYFSDMSEPTSVTLSGMSDLINNTVNAYYQENSYGKVGYSADIFGWYVLPITQAQCNYGTVSSAARAAADPSVDFSQYTHLMIVHVGVTPNCPYGGLASLGKSFYTTNDGRVGLYDSFISTVTPFVVAHELGHNLGLHHAQFFKCDPPFADYSNPDCFPEEYGDVYDTLGSPNMGHFNAAHKEMAHFFDPDMITTAETGTNEYVISPIETATNDLKTIKILRGIKTVWGYNDYVYIEYRRPIGFDSVLSTYGPDVYDGAVLHVLGASNIFTGLLDPTPFPRSSRSSTLPVGSSYTDPLSGIIVETVGQTDDQLGVRVTSARPDITKPLVYVTEPVYGFSYSGIMPISLTASDDTGIARVELRFNSPTATPFTTLDQAPYSTTFDTTQLPNGGNQLYITVYDTAGGADIYAGNSLTTNRFFAVWNDDGVSPSAIVTAPTAGSADSINPVTLAADASDDIGVWKVEFYLDGATTAAIIDDTAPFSRQLTMATGAHTVVAKAYDFSGNQGNSPPVSFTVAADTIKPTVAITSPVDGAHVGGIVPVNFVANDNSGSMNFALLFIDGQPGTSHYPNVIPQFWWDSRTVADGPHQLSVLVSDESSQQQTSVAVNVIVDNSQPTVLMTEPISGSLPATVSLAATANHQSGIQRVDFYRDGVRLIGTDTTAPYQLNWDTQTIPAGSHTITARAVSQTSTATISAPVNVVTVDYTAPTVQLTSPADSATVDGTVTLAAAAADSPGPLSLQIEFYVDGNFLIGTDATAPYAISWNSYTVTPGPHTLTALAKDAAGNHTTSTPVAITTLPPDGVAPGPTNDLTAH